VQAFQFALDPTPEQSACIRRQFGGRRCARNWAVRTLKEDLARYRQTGEQTPKPALPVLRKRWNQAKDTECLDRQTGEVWWPEISKEAFADGIKAGVDAYWNWHASRAGTRAGRRVGFPRFAKKGRDRDRVTFTTGAIRVEPGRRQVTLPRIGTVRVHENTRHHIHRLTTRLAKTHGEIVAGGLDAAGMLRQKGLTGARARRRGLSDSALGEPRRHLTYKTGWYGSRLVVADRWFPSSKTCHACGHVQDIGWAEHWICGSCGVVHQRDDNAAINLARYEPPATGG
jgi:transposase